MSSRTQLILRWSGWRLCRNSASSGTKRTVERGRPCLPPDISRPRIRHLQQIHPGVHRFVPPNCPKKPRLSLRRSESPRKLLPWRTSQTNTTTETTHTAPNPGTKEPPQRRTQLRGNPQTLWDTPSWWCRGWEPTARRHSGSWVCSKTEGDVLPRNPRRKGSRHQPVRGFKYLFLCH